MAQQENKETKPEEEKLERLKVKVSQLESLVASREEELASKDRQIAELEQAIAQKDSRITDLEQSLAAAVGRQQELEEGLSQTVNGYRAAVAGANPEIPEELISGETTEAIDESLASAKKLVSRVKQGLEAEAMQSRFPGGAPVRTALDTSALSPKEKIKYAIGGA